MATPCKRVCSNAARQIRNGFMTRAGPIRSFSSTPARQQQAAENNSKHNPFEVAAQEPAYETDDLSSLAHGELQVHRELRAMLRTAAWEMPLLSQLAESRPFVPIAREKQPLKWRYTTYMGEEHPAAHKVSVEFAVRDLPLDEAQRTTLIKLAGARWNPTTGMVRMSHEGFPSQAQNKRYLGDLIQTMMREAQDPKADSFADVPVDTRHHRPTRTYRFPDEWRMTPERVAELEARRKENLLDEGQRVEQSRIVSGVAAIDYARQLAAQQAEQQALERPDRTEVRVPVGKAKARARR